MLEHETAIYKSYIKIYKKIESLTENLSLIKAPHQWLQLGSYGPVS